MTRTPIYRPIPYNRIAERIEERRDLACYSVVRVGQAWYRILIGSGQVRQCQEWERPKQ